MKLYGVTYILKSVKILLLASKYAMIFVTLSQYWTFLYFSPFSYCSSNYMIAKVVALLRSQRRQQKVTVILSLSPLRTTTLEKEPSKKKQRTDTKKAAKRIKSDNFTRSNREKSNIAIAILEMLMIGTIIISYLVVAIIFSPTVIRYMYISLNQDVILSLN